MEHSKEKRSHGRSKPKSMPLLRPEERITSSRILNEDGSVPRNIDELIIRGFEKLRDEYANRPRRSENEVPSRSTSDGSSKSSATYVCSSPEKTNRVNIPIPREIRQPNPSTSADVPTTSTTAAIEDTRTRLRYSVENHEAKIRAMQAEIAALKRAAILTRELRRETAVEQSTNTRTRDVGGTQRETTRRVQKQSTTMEPVMSGGNGTGKEQTIPTKRPSPIMSPESMNGMPTPPQLKPFELRQATQVRRTQRSERRSSRRSPSEKLCLCPKCISRTQEVVNAVAALYSTQGEDKNLAMINHHHKPTEQISKDSGRSKSNDTEARSNPSRETNHSDSTIIRRRPTDAER